MIFNTTPSKKYPHEWIHKDSFENHFAFYKFINWLSGEYTLYPQDELDGLSVFMPNALFSIKMLKLTRDKIKFSITVKSKNVLKGESILNNVEGILNHLKRIQKV